MKSEISCSFKSSTSNLKSANPLNFGLLIFKASENFPGTAYTTSIHRHCHSWGNSHNLDELSYTPLDRKRYLLFQPVTTLCHPSKFCFNAGKRQQFLRLSARCVRCYNSRYKLPSTNYVFNLVTCLDLRIFRPEDETLKSKNVAKLKMEHLIVVFTAIYLCCY